MKHILILIALLGLAGCKTRLNATLFTSDLIAALEGESLTTPLVISMESDGKCEENAPAALNAVASQYPTADFIGCDKIDYQTFARFRVQIMVLPYTDKEPLPDQPFAIGINNSDARYIVKYLTNPAAARAIWDALPQDMTKYREYKFDPVLLATLNNDLRKPITIVTDDVFADGIPVQGTATRKLPRRDQVELKMSNVTNAAFGNTSNYSSIVEFTVND